MFKNSSQDNGLYQGKHGSLPDQTMLPKDLQRTVQWQCFDGAALAADRRGPKERIVYGLFGGFDYGEEEWRHCVVCKCFDGAGQIAFVRAQRAQAYVFSRGEGDSIV